MHGGAKGSGAPRGNKNALTHGMYTAEAIAAQKKLRAFMKEAEDTLKELSD
ncbi:hypothetical protein M1105_07605 [Limibaculum sp. FT325]|nr:hypothetical protein [Limibaculum sediminis]